MTSSETPSPSCELAFANVNDWVEARLVSEAFERSSRFWFTGVISLPLVLYAVTPYLNDWTLVGLSLLLLATLSRPFSTWLYQRHFGQASRNNRQQFVQRWALSTAANASIWTLAYAVTLCNPASFAHYLMIAVWMGMCVGALTAYANVPLVFHTYLGVMLLVAIGGELYWLLIESIPQWNKLYKTLIPLQIALWLLVINSGRVIRQSQKHAFKLLWEKEHLILSLREQSEKALHAVNVKNRFLAATAHDLKQPVHALRLYAEMLDLTQDYEPEVVLKILRSVNTINNIFDTLFDLARINSGKYPIHIQTLNWSDVLSEVSEQFAILAQEKQLRFRQYLGNDQAKVETDLLSLRRILSNLISNAIKYTSQGGILLSVRQRHDHWLVQVWDTGSGIKNVHLPNIFDEFYRAEKDKDPQDSLGLGLSIAARLAGIFNYPIKVASRVGRGTAFSILVAKKPSPQLLETLQNAQGIRMVKPQDHN